ncbi:MAG TPA: hypothetical protein VFW78_04690 [Bacteroidia bacterium]|nr:hypothetical protein [Bacteroidia bacterium]
MNKSKHVLSKTKKHEVEQDFFKAIMIFSEEYLKDQLKKYKDIKMVVENSSQIKKETELVNPI